MAISTTTDFGDTIPTVIEKARFEEQHACPMASLVDKHTMPRGSGTTFNQPYWSNLTASALTEGVDMSNPQSIVDTNVQITPAEVGCQVILTDKAMRSNPEALANVAGTLLGNAMGIKIDTDLVGELDDGTNSMCGAGTTLALGHIAAGIALLKKPTTHGPCPGPYRLVLHPYQLLDIVDVVTPLLPAANQEGAAGVPSFADDVLRNYFRGNLLGCSVYEDGNISVDASDDAKGGIFGPLSILYVVSDEWSVEDERDASLRATEINVVGDYGVGEYLADWIAEVYSDADTPA